MRNPQRATASGYVTADGGFPPGNAIDGDAATEWILPDHTPGWIDVCGATSEAETWSARARNGRAANRASERRRRILAGRGEPESMSQYTAFEVLPLDF